MVIRVDHGYNYDTYLTIEFGLYKSLDEVVFLYDWITPMVLYDSKSVYYSQHVESLLNGKSNSLLVNTMDNKSNLNPMVGVPYDTPFDLNTCCGCGFCPINEECLADIYYDDDPKCTDCLGLHQLLSKNLLDIGRGVPGASLEFLVWPNEWSDETLDSLVIPISHPFNISSNKPSVQRVLNARLPFEFCEPTYPKDWLCKHCYSLFKPPFSFRYWDIYMNEVVTLYMLLREKGLYWDLVLPVFELITQLKHRDLGAK